MWWVKFCPFWIAKFNDRNKKVANKTLRLNVCTWFKFDKVFQLSYFSANDVVSSTVKEVGKQFQQAFMVENTRKEVFKKVGELENRVNGK